MRRVITSLATTRLRDIGPSRTRDNLLPGRQVRAVTAADMCVTGDRKVPLLGSVS